MQYAIKAVNSAGCHVSVLGLLSSRPLQQKQEHKIQIQFGASFSMKGRLLIGTSNKAPVLRFFPAILRLLRFG